ncbi:hypothetical protein [Streptomyces sp. NPDC093970]|uniref:hypothetical protein n=1 Tax=unclassified Streptomyces TaxID=2593676 RepID=UPI003430690A
MRLTRRPSVAVATVAVLASASYAVTTTPAAAAKPVLDHGENAPAGKCGVPQGA